MSVRNLARSDFPHCSAIPTRWADNDAYGHVNNVVYYSFFDTAINRYLIEQGVLDIQADRVVGYVVDTGCSYFAPVTYPDTVHVGLRVAKIGTSSVRYEVAIFRNADEQPAAGGHFVHVYVDRSTGRVAPVPEAARRLLSTLRVQEPSSGEPPAL